MARPQRNTAASIRVSGAKDLRRTLKAMGDRELMRELGRANKRIGQIVVDEARQIASSQGRQQQRAAETLRASSVGSRVQVQLGGKAGVPYALGAEFGAHHNRKRLILSTGGAGNYSSRRSAEAAKRRIEASGKRTVRYMKRGWNMLPEWRGAGKGAGYFLFPAIRKKRQEIIDAYMREIEHVWGKAA